MTHGPLSGWNRSSAAQLSAALDILVNGNRYEVVAAFVDFDRSAHPVSERWTFLGCSFVPHDDGVSLFVSFDDVQVWQIRMQWRPEEQGAVLDRLTDYLRAVG